MITDVRTLIELCSNELSYRGYTTWNANCYKKHWNQLDEWMKARQISDFSKVMADRYLDGNYSEPPHFNKAIPLLRSKPDIVINI